MGACVCLRGRFRASGLESLRRENARKTQGLEAEAEAYKISARESVEKAKGAVEVRITETRTWASVEVRGCLGGAFLSRRGAAVCVWPSVLWLYAVPNS